MIEDKILQGVSFLEGIKGKNISLEEQKKFLESKLTEEEIAEVYKRVGQQTVSGDKAVNKAQERIAQIDGHFLPNVQQSNQ